MGNYNPQQYINDEWFESLAYTDVWNERALLAALSVTGMPRSFIDVGCGNGRLVDMMYRLLDRHDYTTLAAGIELVQPPYLDGCPGPMLIKQDENGIDIPRCELVMQQDLTQPLKDDITRLGQFDLVISWEVGEHLPEEAADTYLDTLAQLTGDWLLFAAAPPGQNGEGHINCHSRVWWGDKLSDRGLTYDALATDVIRSMWLAQIAPGVALTGPCFWLPQNLQVFRTTPTPW